MKKTYWNFVTLGKDHTRDEKMKIPTCILALLIATFLMYCTSEKTDSKKEVSEKIESQPVEMSSETETQIVCDIFELITNVTGSTLSLSVETDLPDYAVVMVGVSRTYKEKGSPDKYSVDYFSEKSTIGEWRAAHNISIDSDRWKKALKDKQRNLAQARLGFDVESISDMILVNMVVPVNQPNKKFGDRNKNLVGKAVRTTGLRVVEAEIEIEYPLDSPPAGESLYAKNPKDLDADQTYIVSRKTPIMPHHSPADPIAAIDGTKQIPIGGRFKILEVYLKDGDPWYKATAYDQDLKEIGTGWINSTALIGQELKILE